MLSISQVNKEAQEYGYSINILSGEIIGKNDNPLGVTVSVKGNRLYCRSKALGSMLFSGNDIGNFLESYWYAEKINRPLHIVTN